MQAAGALLPPFRLSALLHRAGFKDLSEGSPTKLTLTMAEMHDTTEEYLETILALEEEGIAPMRARLVERLKVSAPPVSETVNRLVEQGYAELLANRNLRLTDKGRTVAVSVTRRHRLAERLLVDVIGLEWEKVHREAARWEHAISQDVEEKLVELLGDPATCPHGNPIPGSRNVVNGPEPIMLSGAAPGRATVVRMSERVEDDDHALDFIVAAALIPGDEITIQQATPTGIEVTTRTGVHVVPAELAMLLFIAPVAA